MKNQQNSREIKTVVFTKIEDFDGVTKYVTRKDIDIEYAREWAAWGRKKQIVKYATFDGNGYSRERRIGYVLEARVYVRDFDFCWLSATYGEGTGTIKGEPVKIRAYTRNLQDSIPEYDVQKIGV